MILRDCPRCGRVNVQGQVYQTQDDNKIKAIITTSLAIGAGTLAGPIALIAAGIGGKKVSDWIIKDRDSSGKVKYRFHCPNPNCNHEWIDWVHE